MTVYVTGMGVVSALGAGMEANTRALKNRLSGIRKDAATGRMFGRYAASNSEISGQVGYGHDYTSRTTLLSILAGREAWGQNLHLPGVRTALVSATSLGGMDITEQTLFHPEKQWDVGMTGLQDNGTVTEELGAYLGITGFNCTISTACSSGANAMMHGARLIEHGLFDRVLAGATDPLAEYNILGFGSLNILDPENSRPFDEHRSGLNLGEGAAYLLLESEKSLQLTGNVPICRLSAWSNTNDAFHQTASSPDGEGARRAMREALDMAGLAPEDIDYINAHGTGTDNNDLSESRALMEIFNPVPPFSSTKGFTGHAMGAAGALEAIYSVLALHEQSLIPTFRFTEPMHETGLMPVTEWTENRNIRHVLNNSFGFGGNCTCLLFSRP